MPVQPRHALAVLLALAAVGGTGVAAISEPRLAADASRPPAPKPPSVVPPAAPGAAATFLARQPLRFEANAGQFERHATFVARGLGYAFAITPSGASLLLEGGADPARVAMTLVGGRRDARAAVGLEPLGGVVNHVRGSDPAAWRLGVRQFGRVRVSAVYPGIDVEYYGNGERLEYDFVLAAGVDPAIIRLRFDGAEALSIDGEGALVVAVPGGAPLRQPAPVTFQTIDGRRRPVASRYVQHGPREVGFALGPFDRRHPVTIDPVLTYSTYFGGTSDERIGDLALDAAGNVYVTGHTFAAAGGFPATAGAFQATRQSDTDAFVAKFDPAGSSLIYATYLGGAADENRYMLEGGRVAADPGGNAYVVGETRSPNFPVTGNAFDGSYGGGFQNPFDVFLVKLGPTGGLLYGTYIGGSDGEWATGVQVDAAGNIYVSGGTRSDAAEGFPHPASAYDGTLSGGYDAFLVKFDAAGTRLYSTLFGGTISEQERNDAGALAVDDAGRAYLVGDTSSANMPVVNAAQPVYGGGLYDGYLAVIDTTQAGAAGLVHATYLGGTGTDFARAIAYAGNRQVVVGGVAGGAGVPVGGGFDPTHNGGSTDGFLLRIDTSLAGAASVVNGSFLGGSSNDQVTDLDLDSQGVLHVVGTTQSADFPFVAPTSTIVNLTQPFVARVNAAGTALTFATSYGGSTNGHTLNAVATNAAGETIVAGATNLTVTNPPSATGFPLVTPFQAAYGGGNRDAVIARYGTPGDTDSDGLPDDWETRFGLDPASPTGGSGAADDPDADGRTNAQELADGSHPRGFVITYLAEGATGSFFHTRLALANPTASPARVLCRFQTDTGAVVPEYRTMAPFSRLTLEIDGLPGLGNVSFSSLVEADVQIVADRTMTWGPGNYGSHAERGVLTRTATEWFLAEGATHGNFDLFYLIQNPGPVAASVEITYLRPAPQAPVVRTYAVPGNRRQTIRVDDVPGLAATDVSAVVRTTNAVPIVVERAMYLNRPDQVYAAGHESAGVTAPALRWFLAEGATGSFFNMFILVANPGTQATTVRFDYLLPNGTVISRDHAVAAQSRLTINAALDAPELASAAVSTVVSSLSTVPIVVERAMWWPVGNWYEAHNSSGETVTGPRWAMADGESGGPDGAQTYVLLANTSTFAGMARVTLLFEDGTTAVSDVPLPASSRTNVDVQSRFPTAANRRYGVRVDSLGATPAELVVERAMYTNANGVIWGAGTNALATKLP